MTDCCVPHNQPQPCAKCAEKAEFRKQQAVGVPFSEREGDQAPPVVDDRRDESWRENFAKKPTVSEG